MQSFTSGGSGGRPAPGMSTRLVNRSRFRATSMGDGLRPPWTQMTGKEVDSLDAVRPDSGAGAMGFTAALPRRSRSEGTHRWPTPFFDIRGLEAPPVPLKFD